jgi:hypothetical protein
MGTKYQLLRPLGCSLFLIFLCGCDPSINLYGSFFPAWIWCVVLGVGLTVMLRFVFAALRLERNLGPLVLMYPCLALILACVAWLILFQH